MPSLILETSHENSYLILSNQDQLLVCQKLPKRKELSTKIHKILKELLDKEGFSLDDLQYVATSVGPGSYTGIRLGACIAKVLSYTKNIPLIGFVSLHGFYTQKEGPFIIALDANMGGLYVQSATKTNNEIIYHKDPTRLSLTQAEPLLEKANRIISPDYLALRKKMPKYSEKIYETDVDPKHLCNLCFALFEKKQFSLKKPQLKLFYLHGPSPT